MKERRFLFLRQRVLLFEDAETFARYVRHLRHSGAAQHSEKIARMLDWADSYLADMRAASSATAIDEELMDSEL